MTAPVLVVTGGSRGIGAAMARLAARGGYHVLLSYARDRAAADAVLGAIRDAGGSADAVQADVGVEDDILALFAAADRLGPLRVLVNNAGIVDRPARVEDMTRKRLERMIAVNLTGSILCAREAVRRMSSARGGAGGAIVNLSSAAAKLGGADQYVDYASTKGAVDTFTVGLAREVAAVGIRVCAVRPGIIDTEIHASGGQPDRVAQIAGALPMQRAGTAEEVARAILWLASPDAAYSTGAILDVSGGRSVLP